MNKLIGVPVIVILATFGLYLISKSAPQLNENDEFLLKFPSTLTELKNMANLLKQYKQDNIYYVILLFCYALIYKQTFAIPGSFMINILGGAIFGVTYGFPLVCVLTATGASMCYQLSNYFAKEFVSTYFHQKITSIQRQINDNKNGLFFILLSLRLFPMSPNWFLNIVSPILNIPLGHFFFSIFFGLMPYNFICVQTGSILSQIESLDDIITWSTAFKLLFIALVSLLPSIF